MIEIKHWWDYSEDRKKSNRTLVIYGASGTGYELIRAGIIPDFFCDRNANEIKNVTMDDGRKIPVLGLDELGQMNSDMDIIVGIIDPRHNIPKIIENISGLFSEPYNTCNIRIYKCSYEKDDLNKPFEISGKKIGKTINNDFYFIENKIFEKEYRNMLRSAFFNSNQMTDDDFSQLFSEASNSLVFKNNTLCFNEKKGKYISYLNGKRHTVEQPVDYDNIIQIFGDSRINGLYYEDQFTLCSQLQALINKSDLKYRVENYAISGLSLLENIYQIKNTQLKKGDIVFFAFSSPPYEDQNILFEFVLDAHDYCKKNESSFIFVDIPFMLDRVTLSPWEKFYLQTEFSPEECMERKNKLTLSRADLQLYCNRNSIIFINIDSRFYDSSKTIFLDFWHWGDYGNQILANQLFEIIQLLSKERNVADITWQKKQLERQALEDIVEKTNPGCKKYIEEILRSYPPPQSAHSTGAIVMNCNPFTKGHRYLIEKTLEQVELLYIFVVEEDKANYSFADRFNLVKENTKDLPNVIVAPSGKFIISSITFPGYFSKEITTEQPPDTSLDILTFALKIAPALNITTRFVGEEPYCMVTRSYNEQMKNILPQYGIDVIEIPRSGVNGDIISASKVRLLIKEGKMHELGKYVPDVTLKYLMQGFPK